MERMRGAHQPVFLFVVVCGVTSVCAERADLVEGLMCVMSCVALVCIMRKALIGELDSCGVCLRSIRTRRS